MPSTNEFIWKSYPSDVIIFREGESANCAYLLKAGRVGITTKKDDEPVLLTTILPNQIFGELALIDGSPRSATAITLERSEVIVVGREDFDRHVDDLNDFMKYWIRYMTGRVRDLSKRIDS